MPSSYTPSLRLVLPVEGDLDGTWDWLVDEAAKYDDNLSVASGRSASYTTPEEIRNLESQLNSLMARADQSSGSRKIELLKDIEQIEKYISKAKNNRRRSSGPDDGHRQAIYHEMEAALTLLALECPALAGHLGTLHKLQRRRFQTEDGQIVYNPGFEAAWITEPVGM